MLGITKGNPKLVPFVREAIEKHKLDRTFITNRLLGEGAVMANQGGVANVIEYIAMNEPQFSLEDTPETANQEALRDTACVFADIIGGIDKVPVKELS